MENLKITFQLESPAIFQYRFTTIDSILLSLFIPRYKKEHDIVNFIETKDLLDEIGKFINVEKGIISGSIWYKEPSDPICKDTAQMYKTMRHQEYLKYGLFTKSQFNTSSGPFKAYSLDYHTIALPKVYFYIRGDKDIIAGLLSDVRHIGKKRKIGWGFLNETDNVFNIEVIGEDKSVLLDETTVAKPIPCSKMNIKTHRIMFMPEYAPYWSNKNKVASYMPPAYYEETKDTTFSDDFQSEPIDYISQTKFVFKHSGILTDTPKTPEHKHTCIMCGGEDGIKRDSKEKDAIISSRSFNDFNYVSSGDHICDFCKIVESGGNYTKFYNCLFSEAGNKVFYSQTDEDRFYTRAEFLRNLKNLKPPFWFSIKTGKNPAHVVFKGNVAISNAMFQLVIKPTVNGQSLMTRVITVDTQMLNEAIAEAELLIANDKNINKFRLIYPDSKDTQMITHKFKSKYTQDIMLLLAMIL